MRLTAENTAAFVVDYQEKILPAIWEEEKLIKTSSILIRGLKALGVPLIGTTQYRKGLGETDPRILEAVGDIPFFDKQCFSIMDAEEAMKALPSGTTNIILLGIETHICILQTAIDLLSNGYQVYLPADCLSAGSEDDHRYGLIRARQEGAWISTSEALMMEILRVAKGPAFKKISALLKESRKE